MTRSAVRLTPRQLERLDIVDDELLPIAEIHRRWARWAADNGLLRPSYERTRLLVHELRSLRGRERRTRELRFDLELARSRRRGPGRPVTRTWRLSLHVTSCNEGERRRVRRLPPWTSS